jgi:hypothetical protein
MSLPESCTSEQFLKDVAKHGLQVKVDNGLYKHLTFSNNGSMVGRFDLVTWPGYLTICGDYGTFVFSRIPDMFEFFRTDRRRGSGMRSIINPGYWAEKCQAHDRCGIQEFHEEYFKERILEALKEFLKEYRCETTQTERNQLWKALNVEVLLEEDEHAARQAAWNFRHPVNSRVGDFSLQDVLCDSSFTTYTFHYLWCCYAIAWGVWQYDKLMESKNADRL